MKALLPLMLLVASASAAAASPQDLEDVAITFDRYKGRLYAAYAKELRVNPELQGKADLVIDIAKSGEVTGCRVRASTLGSPSLEAKLCEEVRLMKFTPRAEGFTTVKPVAFFPAAKPAPKSTGG